MESTTLIIDIADNQLLRYGFILFFYSLLYFLQSPFV